MNKDRLLDALKLEVIYPAKSRILINITGQESRVLVSENGRFLGHKEKSLGWWVDSFHEAKLSFEDELRKLVKSEIGESFDIKECSFSGYLGVASDTWYEVV